MDDWNIARLPVVLTEIAWFSKHWEGIEQVFRCCKLLHHVCCTSSGLDFAIENRLHWRRDVTLGEDACQTRTGPVPGLLARLNSTVLSLMDRAGVCNVARQMRYFNAHLEQALNLVLDFLLFRLLALESPAVHTGQRKSRKARNRRVNPC